MIYIIAIVGSFIAGAINTLAGNGSAITLTILTEVLGLPPNMANGTNRLGVASQSLVASWVFHKNKMLDFNRDRLLIIFTLIGAIIGVWVATQVSNAQFKTVFSYLLVGMLAVILIKPKRWLRATDSDYKPSIWVMVPAFLGIGFYGGFIQMGMGIFFLAIMVLGARYSLMDANAVKAIIVGLYTVVVIFIFAWKGMIDWKIGFLMAVGQTAGGWLTAHYGSRYEQANVWAHRLLVVIIIAAIIKLFGWHELMFND
ncbi:MAG TPA: sulfite exporter TauE/SafE family protein [Bacteroidetes bacterium]|nr:sulfite exporter TauE/SafE family protein [Bacteroidota bacterium]